MNETVERKKGDIERKIKKSKRGDDDEVCTYVFMYYLLTSNNDQLCI